MKYILKLIFLNRYVTRFFKRIWYWEPSFDNILVNHEEHLWGGLSQYIKENLKHETNSYSSVFITSYNEKTKKYTIRLEYPSLKTGVMHEGPLIEVDRKTFHKLSSRPLKITKSMQLKMNNQ